MILWRCLHLPLSTPVMFGDVLWRRPQTDMPIPTDSSYAAAASTAWWYQSLGWVCTLVTWSFYFLFFHWQRQNPKDVHTLAQLISAYSLVDPEKAKVYPFGGGIRAKKEAFGHCSLGFQLCVEFRPTLTWRKARNISDTATISRSSCLELYYFPDWFDYCTILGPFCLSPPSLWELIT